MRLEKCRRDEGKVCDYKERPKIVQKKREITYTTQTGFWIYLGNPECQKVRLISIIAAIDIEINFMKNTFKLF